MDTCATPPPTPQVLPTNSDGALEGSMTCAGISLADAESNAGVYASAVADVYDVQANRVTVTFSSGRRRLQSGSVVVDYTILYATMADATAAVALVPTATVFDAAVQTAAADAGVSSVFATATVDAVAAPVAAQPVSTKSPTAYEEDECDGGCIAFILIVCVMLPLCCLCGIVYLCRKMMCKKKDEGTKVAPAAKPDKAPAAAYSQAPTQQQTMTITIPPGAGPGTTLRVMTPSRQPMDIVVPPGAGPGTQLQVPVPVR